MLYVKDCKYTTSMPSKKKRYLFSFIRGLFRAKKSREFPGFPGTPLKIPVSRELQNGREIANTNQERKNVALNERFTYSSL